VATVIRGLLERHPFKRREIAVSLSGNAVIVKKITVPDMTDEDLADCIAWEAEPQVPFDIEDVNLDYQILNRFAGTQSGTMEVLVVAAKKERVADHATVITRAGCVPVVVDVDAFALQNAYESNYDLEPGSVIVLLNAGASAMNINILGGGQPLFTRDISIGGNAYTEAIQKELGLPFDRAERLKKGESLEGASYEEALPVVRAVTEHVLREILKTFDFYRGTAPSDRIDRVLLSGGSSQVDGFARALEDRFDTPVEMFDPFRRIAFDPVKLGVADRDSVATTAAVAVGLALRRADDR